ncbi:MAG: hypothetical protein MJ176_00125 [Treponema sp.]|nr:hypothetical protein [Treponema sp.]
MDFKQKFDNIKDILQVKIADLKDFVEENKKISILVLSLVLVILLCIVLIFVSLGGSKKKVILDDPLILTSDLMVPPNPANPDSFQLSRTTKDKWEVSEIEPYFTKPSEKETDDLSKANDKIIKELLEAAP